MTPAQLLHPTPKGLYCPPGDFYVDPVAPVPRALVTHGHADHARAGHHEVWATQRTLDIMAIRYGEDHCHTPHPVNHAWKAPMQVMPGWRSMTPQTAG